MSKLFGPSMRNIGSNAGLILEENERFQKETSINVVRGNNVERFAIPSAPKVVNRRNPSFKSRLFSHNVETSDAYEDISNIEFEARGTEDLNAPSTSSASLQQRQFSNNGNLFRSRLGSIDAGSTLGQEHNRLFRLLPRESISNSRLQYKNQESNFVGKNESEVSVTRKFGLGMRNSTLSIPGGLREKISLNYHEKDHESNSDFVVPRKQFGFGLRSHLFERETPLRNTSKPDANLNFHSKTTMPRMFETVSRSTALESCSFREDGLRSRHNSVTSFRNNNSHVGISTTSRNACAEARNIPIYQEGSIPDGVNFNEESNYDNHSLVRPSISRVIRPRNSTMSSCLFSYNNVERYNKDSSSASRFNVTHISRREVDPFSDSRLVSNLRQNPVDNHSIADSVVSIASVKAELRNFVEVLHHSVLNMAPDLPVEFVRKEFDKAKELLENIKEISFVPTIKETDATSVVSHSSQKHTCGPTASKMGSKNILDCPISLKTGKEVLKTLIASKRNNTSHQLPRIEEERKASFRKTQNQISYEENEDSALLFKKPKPFAKSGKKVSKMLKIKSPKSLKKSNQEINLKQWYPVSIEGDLTFCGIIENGTPVQTEAVRKRISNRKLELINGLECNLIGNPADNLISAFSKTLKSMLKDGLTNHWRKFQKELLNHQNSTMNRSKSSAKSQTEKKSTARKRIDLEEEKEIYDTTPKTRRNPEALKRGKQRKSHRISISPVTKKIKLKTKVKKSLKATAKEKKRDTKLKEGKKNKALTEGEKKISPKREKTEKNNTPMCNKSLVESASRTRSGRTVKPPKQLMMTGKKEKNFNKNVEKVIKKTVHSSPQVEEEEEEEIQSKTPRLNKKRKIAGDADVSPKKKTKTEKSSESSCESMAESKKSMEKKKKSTNKFKKRISRVSSVNKKSETLKSKRKNKKTPVSNNSTLEVTKSITTKSTTEIEEDFELQLDDIEIPEMANVSGKLHLNRSELRMVSMETPPLKYFNTNFKMLKSVTPTRSPNWCIAQRTESEVKQFQRRREISHKKKIITGKKETVKKSSNLPKSKDLKNALDWVKDKLVRTPIGGSRVLNSMIPSRRKMGGEEDQEEEEEEEDSDNESFEE